MSALGVFPLTNYQVAGGIRGLGWPVMKTSELSTVVSAAPNFYEARVANTVNPRWHWTQIWNYLKDNSNDVPAFYAPYTDYETLQGFFLAQGGQDGSFLYSDPADNYVGPAIKSGSWRANWTPLINAVIVDSANHIQEATVVTGPTGWSTPSFNHSGGSITDGGVTWQDLALSGGAEPNPAAQLQLVTDGTYWYSPLQRNFGGQFLEDITDLNTTTAIGGSALQIYADGVLQSSGNYELLGPGLALPNQSFMGMYIQWTLASPTAPPVGPITAQFNYFFRVRFESDELDFEEFLSQVWTMGGPDTRNGAGYLKLETARPNPL